MLTLSSVSFNHVASISRACISSLCRFTDCYFGNMSCVCMLICLRLYLGLILTCFILRMKNGTYAFTWLRLHRICTHAYTLQFPKVGTWWCIEMIHDQYVTRCTRCACDSMCVAKYTCMNKHRKSATVAHSSSPSLRIA